MTRGVKDLSYCVVGVEDNEQHRITESGLLFTEAASHAAQNRERGHNSYVVEEYRRRKKSSDYRRVGTITLCVTDTEGKRKPLLQYDVERWASEHVVAKVEEGLERARTLLRAKVEEIVVTYDIFDVLARTFYPPKRGKGSQPLRPPLVYTLKPEGTGIIPIICVEAVK